MTSGLSVPAGFVQAIGFAAATLTTVSFAPQVIRTWRFGGKDLSPIMLLLFGSGVGLWLGYGVLTGSRPVIAANALTAVQLAAIALFSRCKRPHATDRTDRPDRSGI